MTGLRKPQDRSLTWDDYRSWNDDQRWEIVGGEAFAMTPAPLERHQSISAELFAALHSFFKGKACKVYHAPTDLKLSEHDIVQPDLLVVRDPSQKKRTHIEGPPNLVIEILSPASEHHDRVRKLALYARSGVQEVWVVTPFPSSIEIFLLDGATYRLMAAYRKEETLVSPSFPGLQIELAGIFDFPVDPDEELHLIKEGRPPAYAVSR
jgi:Uma2 family endonuclease